MRWPRVTFGTMSTRTFPYPVRGRRSVRLRGHDYRSGTYFVTICADDQVHTFGEVAHRHVHLSPAGRIAKAYWLEIPRRHANVRLDAFVVMPNHIHGILCFVDAGVTIDRPRRFSDAQPGSLATILGSYKAEVTKSINADRHTPGQKVWQRNYYEHVIRSEADLHQIRWCIITNPIRWNRTRRSRHGPGNR